jgi:hypothetical protein
VKEKKRGYIPVVCLDFASISLLTKRNHFSMYLRRHIAFCSYIDSGVLGDLDLIPRLNELKVTVLLTHGKFDTMRPSTVKAIQDQIPISERVMFPHSGHVSMIDDAALMNDVVASFISRVEKGGEIGGRMNEGGGGRVAEEEATEAGGTVAKNTPCISWTWIKVVFTFLAGFLIGEMKIGRRRNRDGYTSV